MLNNSKSKMSTLIEQVEKVRGNKQYSNFKVCKFQATNWVMVWNNYPEDAMSRLSKRLVPLCKDWTFGEEIGEQGTRHIQGCFLLKRKMRQDTIWNTVCDESHARFWMDKMKAKEWSQASDYCKKDCKFITSDEILIECEKPSKKLKFMWDIISKWEPAQSDRTVHIIVDKIGGIGKTEFCRYCVRNLSNIIVTSGRGIDMKNQILEYKNKNNRIPKYILMDVPRYSSNSIRS